MGCTQYFLVLAVYLISSTGGNNISPAQSQYDVEFGIQATQACSQQKLDRVCSNLLPILNYRECALLTQSCNKNIVLRISFTSHKEPTAVLNSVQAFKSSDGMIVTSYDITDVNECQESIHKCSRNSACTNTLGSYQCHCGFGYKELTDANILPGTFCVARCNGRSCRNGATCEDAADEVSEVTCHCRAGYSGNTCQQVSGTGTIPYWSIVFISILTALAALIGITLCIYTCYRLIIKGGLRDGDSDTNSLASYKPRAIPQFEYDRITDIGSVASRGNRGYASTIDEEPEEYNRGFSLKNDGLKFGSRLMGSGLSIPSEHGDPTPVLNPQTGTDRHSATDIVPQSDYY